MKAPRGILAAVVRDAGSRPNSPRRVTIRPSSGADMGWRSGSLVPFTGLRCDDRASDLISGVCLSLFLVMTMMALNLVEVALSAGPFLVIIAAQVVFIILYAIYVCFRFMGRDYEAAVTSAAFIGFNMVDRDRLANLGITKKYGPAPELISLSLAVAFFIDLMNRY